MRHWNFWGDLAAAGSVLAALMGYLPYIAAGLGIIWYCVQFWESPLRKRLDMQRKLTRLERLERSHRERAREIARLKERLEKEQVN